MDLDVLKLIVLSIMGLAVWFLKMNITDTKKEIHELRLSQEKAHDNFRNDIETVKREYLHRDDFREFKSELRTMFDELRTDIRALNTKNNG
jgi:hypothetical protein